MQWRVVLMACVLSWAQVPWAHALPVASAAEAPPAVHHAHGMADGPAAATPPAAADCCGGACLLAAGHCACAMGLLPAGIACRSPEGAMSAPATSSIYLPPGRPPDFFRPPI